MKDLPVIPVVALCLSLAALGHSQNFPGDPEHYPPKKYPVTVLSSDSTFDLRKLEGAPPARSGEDFVCKTDLAKRTVTIEDKAGRTVHQVTIPTIRELDPKLERAGLPDGFKAVRVTRGGNLIFRYYEMDEFYYSRSTGKFTVMPSFLKDGDEVFQCSGWTEFAEDLFLAHLGTRYSQGDGISIFNAKSQKSFRLKVPADLESEYVGLDAYDSSHSIVDVQILKNTDPREDLELQITGELGFYRIELTARNKHTADSASVTLPPQPSPPRPRPEPPAKPWKCTFHEKLPDHLKEQPPSPKIVSGEELDTDPKIGESSFRSPEIPIPFAEFEHKIRLNDANVLFVWAATEKTLPAIDLQHQRVVQPVFGPVDTPAGSHYVFSIRDSESDEITVISIPIPKDLMVEVLGWLEPQAPGWIAINTRKDGAASPTPGWLHLSLDK